MPYEFYWTLHILGILLTFLAIGGIIAHNMNGGTKDTNEARTPLAAIHGTGLLLVLVAGFGMLARLGASPAEPWAIGKLVIWLALGGIIAPIYKMPRKGAIFLAVVPLLGAAAALLVLLKPGA